MTTRTRITSAMGRIATVGAVALSLTAIVPATAQAAPKTVRLWVDPGHGGKDPGAIGGNVREKDTNLEISRLVVKAAKRQGWAVGTSRNSDRFIQLDQRPGRAGAYKADAFVSIHSNSAGKRPTGHMTIYRGGRSAKLGANIMSQLAPLTPYKDIGNKSDVRGLAVLRGAKMPAVIVELLSVGNGGERKTLTDPVQQQRMAEAIVRGIARDQHVAYKWNPTPAPKPAVTPETTGTPTTTSTPKAEPKTAAPKTAAPKTAAPKAAPKASTTKQPTAKAQPQSAPKTSAPKVRQQAAPKKAAPAANPAASFLTTLLRALFG